MYAVMLSPRTDYSFVMIHFKLQKTHNASNIHLPGSFYYDLQNNVFFHQTMRLLV